MHILHNDIGFPTLRVAGEEGNELVLVVGPLAPGFGQTLGNALRRVLLSSVPGAAITAVKFAGEANHEYRTIAGATDAVLDICLNLKALPLKKASAEAEIAELKKKGTGDVTAADIAFSSDVELLDSKHVITHLSKKSAELSVEIRVEKGVGYRPAVENTEQYGAGWIAIDADFSPVTEVNFEVESARVGEHTDLENLRLTIQTNGSLTPKEAFSFASSMLESYMGLFSKGQFTHSESAFIAVPEDIPADGMPPGGDMGDAAPAPAEKYTPVEVLNFTPRTLNALINGDIGSVEELLEYSASRLGSLRGFGQKAMDEVEAVLAERGLSLSDDKS